MSMDLSKQMLLKEARDYVGITLGVLLYASAWAVFLLPYEIVAGGVTGISAIIFYATGFHIENSYALINVALLLVALKILGWKFLVKTIYAIIALYFALKITQDLMPKMADGSPVQILGAGQEFMSVIIGCTLTGSGLGIVFLNNGSTGGTDIIAACVNKFYNMSLGQVLLALDFVIIGSCFFIPEFGDSIQRAHKVVFGFCTMVIENFMIDYIMKLRQQSVQFLIFSRKHKDIATAIEKVTERGITILDGHGWYTGNEVKVVCLIARKNESTTVFRLIKLLDPKAFVSMSSVIGVYGEGFDAIKVKVNSKKLLQTVKPFDFDENATE